MNTTFPPAQIKTSPPTTHSFDHDKLDSGRYHEPEPRRTKLGSNDNGSSIKAELTITQRMIAATSGSLLTSLLVTPLDVVRVRLQSQTPNSIPWTSNITSSLFSSTSLAASSTRSALPFQPFSFPSAAQLSRPLSELGVTTCCREIFWVPTTNEACVAGTAASSTTFKSTTAAMESCLAEQASRRNFNGTWEGLVKIARYEGLQSLYRGLSPTLLMAIPANVIYFTGYDALRYSPKSPMSGLSDNAAPLVAGSVARMAAASIISPLELFRTRLQAMPHHGESSMTAFRETVDSVRGMVAREGVTSLWRGLTITLWRDVPFSGIYWWGYEATKQALIEQRSWKTHDLSMSHSGGAKKQRATTFTDAFLAGSLSGAVAAFVTQPFDVGKTRRQVWTKPENVADTAAVKAAEEGSIPKILFGIYEKEGVRGLWKGCVPRLLKISPACAIMISSYEVTKTALAAEQ